MIFNDPPIHTALRDPVRTAFTPRSVARLREQIEHETAAIIDRLGGEHEFDLVAEVAYPLPATVIAIMLGVPVERHTEFQEWSHQLGALVMGKIERRDAWDRAVMAAQEFQRVFGGLIERYSKNPEDNLITRLVEASASVEKSLTADQLVGACSLLLFGGHETTTSLIANGTLAMLRRPEVRERLVAEPELQKSAVDEFLRFDGPSKIVVRRARNSEPWNGIPVKAGDAIFCCIAAANRDPAVFDRPNDLILDRNPNRHVSFGWGMHHCLGAQLARLEASIVIPQVFRAWPDLKLAVADDQLRYHHTIVGRTLRELPVSIA
jgi:cytochrome P450